LEGGTAGRGDMVVVEINIAGNGVKGVSRNNYQRNGDPLDGETKLKSAILGRRTTKLNRGQKRPSPKINTLQGV